MRERELYSTQHADEQLFDRHGVFPTLKVWRQAFLDLIEGKSVLLAKQSNHRERHIVRIGGVAVTAMYDPHAARFITVLPPHYHTDKRKRGRASDLYVRTAP